MATNAGIISSTTTIGTLDLITSTFNAYTVITSEMSVSILTSNVTNSAECDLINKAMIIPRAIVIFLVI